MSVEWEDLPPVLQAHNGRVPKWEPLLEQLIERPGQWAVLERYESKKSAYNAGSDLRRGKVRMPKGSFEFAVRSDGHGGGKVYARYLGEAHA